MLDVVDGVMGWLKDFSSSPWFYAIIFVIAVLDSLIPIVPSETLVIVGGVAAGTGSLSSLAAVLRSAFGVGRDVARSPRESASAISVLLSTRRSSSPPPLFRLK